MRIASVRAPRPAAPLWIVIPLALAPRLAFVALTWGPALACPLPVWLTVIVLSRDIAIVLTVAIVNLAVGQRTFRPSPLGKLATAIYLLTGVIALYANYRREALAIVPICIYAALAVTLASGVHYVVMLTRGAPAADVTPPSSS